MGKKQLKWRMGTAILLAILLIGISYNSYVKIHTFTLSGNEIMKNEQIQPISGSVKVTGNADTDIVSASNSASDTLISIADSVTEVEITHIVSGTESQRTVNSDDELEALKNWIIGLNYSMVRGYISTSTK
jgi:hypothetical protein